MLAQLALVALAAVGASAQGNIIGSVGVWTTCEEVGVSLTNETNSLTS